MKYITILILVFTGIIFSQCKKGKEPCKKEIPGWCNLADLSDRYDPVCGCDGKTYQNAGYAECVGGISEYKEGKCR